MSYNYTTSSVNVSFNETEPFEPVLNVTRELPVKYVVVLFGYITPVFFVITVVANIIIVLILSRPDMRTPTNLVLLSMAVADLLTLIFPVPWYFYMYTLGNYRHYLYPSVLCNLYNYMSEVLPAFFHTASIWCTLLLACQRYIYICHPSMAKVWCTNKRVTKTIGGIFLLAFVHQLLRFFDSHYENTTVLDRSAGAQLAPINTQPYATFTSRPEPNQRLQRACRLVMAHWVTQVEDVYFVTYFMFRIIFVHIGPCLLLVVFNVLLYSALKRAEITRNKLFIKHNITNNNHWARSEKLRSYSLCPNGNNTGNGAEQMLNPASRLSICMPDPRKGIQWRGGLGGGGRDANSTTFMLIVVVSVFLLVEIPLAITTAVHVTENVFELELVSDKFLNMTIIFSNFFIIISYPLNFAIYCGMSRAFRETFQQLFLRHTVLQTTTTTTTAITTTTTNTKHSPIKDALSRTGTVSNQCQNMSTVRNSVVYDYATNNPQISHNQKPTVDSGQPPHHQHNNIHTNDRISSLSSSSAPSCSSSSVVVSDNNENGIQKYAKSAITDHNGNTRLLATTTNNTGDTNTTKKHSPISGSLCETML